MSVETTYLALEKESAARRISDRVQHVRRSSDGDTIEFRTNVGLHLATLSDALVESGERGSKLRYRTSWIRPHLFHAHHKAREIRDAVAEFRTTPSDR